MTSFTEQKAYIFEVDEDGHIGNDFTSVSENKIPLWADFEEWVETRRSEREEMYGVEYVSHIFESEYELELQVNSPSE